METFEENNMHSLKLVILENIYRQYKEYKWIFLAAIYHFLGPLWFLMLDGFTPWKTARTSQYVSVM